MRCEPELLSWSAGGDSLSAELSFPPDGVWFAGHFPGFPVLPGVAQLFFARKFARRVFCDFPDAGMYRRIKFRRLVRPNEHATLEVRRKGAGAFSFGMSVGGQVALSGEVENVADVEMSPTGKANAQSGTGDIGSAGNVLDELLPHRPPMTMLSRVLSVEERGIAVAVVDASQGSVFYDPEIGGVPACAALEYMAQTMALAVGAEWRRRGGSPRVGFVLGTRRMEVKEAAFRSERRYVARAKCCYADGEFASFDCSIEIEGGEVVASAMLTAYQPPEDMLAGGEVELKAGR